MSSATAERESTADTSSLTYALAYAAHGWRVLPLEPGSKRPHRAHASHGFKDATCDREQITRWFVEDPAAGLGLHPGPAGLVALDIDIKNGQLGHQSLAALEVKHGSLPDTLTARTPSGGEHRLYRCSTRLGNKQLAAGIDVRSADGYIACEPTKIDGKSYQWIDWDVTSGEVPECAELPSWVVAELAGGESIAAPKTSPAATVVDSFTLSDLRDALSAISSDDYQTWIRMGLALNSLGRDGEELWKTWSRSSAKYDEQEADRKWQSFRTRGQIEQALEGTTARSIDYRSVFREAAACGWVNPRTSPSSSRNPEGGSDVRRERFTFLSAEELWALPPITWRLQSVLPTTGLAALFGPSGSGKSFLVLDLANAIAQGTERWFGLRTVAAPVLYCALEGEAGIAKRLSAWQTQRQQQPCPLLRFMTQPFSIVDDAGALADAVQAANATGCMVILDTLNRAAPGLDENDSKDMGRLIHAAKALQTKTGGLVLLVHHTGKDVSRGLRGHSSLLASLDACMEVSRDGAARSWRVAKSKDGEDGAVHHFRLDTVMLGTDEFGDPISSCVVTPIQHTAADSDGPERPIGGNQRVVFSGLQELLASGSVRLAGPIPACVPDGVPAILLEDAVQALAAQMTCETKRRTSRVRTAIQGLVNRGVLHVMEGWLWVS